MRQVRHRVMTLFWHYADRRAPAEPRAAPATTK
jgi:hypothetical protein